MFHSPTAYSCRQSEFPDASQHNQLSCCSRLLLLLLLSLCETPINTFNLYSMGRAKDLVVVKEDSYQLTFKD